MNDIIKIEDLIYKYDDKLVFNRLNLAIKENTWNTIIGPNGSGKSTLIKILTGLLNTDSYIEICGIKLCNNNITEIRKKIGITFENQSDIFVSETAENEIVFKLENLNYPKKKIKDNLSEISKLLKIDKLLDKDLQLLSNSDKKIVALASSVIDYPKILILDEALTGIDEDKKNIILKALKKLQKEKNMTIINVTHNPEELLYSDNIIILNNGTVELTGTKEEVLKQEKLFNKLGLELPFMASLSLKLISYNLIDKLIFDTDEMVNVLWK